MSREIQIRPAVLPLVGAIFAAAVGSILGQYIALFYRGWAFPGWLFPILLVFALESMYYSVYVLSPRTPFTWRLFELGAMVVLIELCLRATRSVTYPWWALWRSAADLDFIIPFALAVFVWGTAGGFGYKLARITKVRDELGDQAAATLSWEYDSIAMKAPNTTLPVEYFLFRLMGFGFLGACLAVAARRSGHYQSMSQREQFVLFALHVLALTCGLLLQGGAYLHRLTVIWQHINVPYPRQLLNGWLRNLVIVCLGVAVLVSIMPVDFSPITYDNISGGIARLLMRMFDGPPQRAREQAESPDPGTPPVPWVQPEEGEPPFWAGLLAVLYMLFIWGFTLLALVIGLGFLLITLVHGELERLRGLPRAAAQFFLAVQESVRQLVQFVLRHMQRVKERVRIPKTRPAAPWELEAPRPDRRGRQETAAVRDIRGAFRQLLQEAAGAGIPARAGETPGEFGSRLGEALPECGRDILEFMASYHMARYSRRELASSLSKAALAQAERIIAALHIVRRKDNDRTDH